MGGMPMPIPIPMPIPPYIIIGWWCLTVLGYIWCMGGPRTLAVCMKLQSFLVQYESNLHVGWMYRHLSPKRQ